MKKERNSKWTRKNIFNAIDTFLAEHHQLPSPRTLDRTPNLPTHTSIKNRFGINVMEFYETYYTENIYLCQSRIYHYQSVEYWVNNFKEQYVKLNYPTMEEYDHNRDKGTPCSRHLIKLTKTKSWNEFIYSQGFDVKLRSASDARQNKFQNDKLNTDDLKINDETYGKACEMFTKLHLLQP